VLRQALGGLGGGEAGVGALQRRHNLVTCLAVRSWHSQRGNLKHRMFNGHDTTYAFGSRPTMILIKRGLQDLLNTLSKIYQPIE
jgi:hypothetical protein